MGDVDLPPLAESATEHSGASTTWSSALAANTEYELVYEINRGSTGVVYLVRNRRMDRLEALKVIRESVSQRIGAPERFEREMRSAARLNHPNIVTAYSSPPLPGLLAFAMEFVDGTDLSSLVLAHGPLPVSNACFYVNQVANGLQHADDRQMVHRDIKPQNLVLMCDGDLQTIKILDFGLAKATSEHPTDGSLTGEGEMMGTPHYVAPEQIINAATADIRADIYSLGCTLYYLLSGHPPFKQYDSLYRILRAHEFETAPLLNELRPEVPADLAAIAAKMMAKDPAERFQKPADVAQAMAPFFSQGIDPMSPGDGQFRQTGIAASESATLVGPVSQPSHARTASQRRPGAGKPYVPAWGSLSLLGGLSIVALLVVWKSGILEKGKKSDRVSGADTTTKGVAPAPKLTAAGITNSIGMVFMPIPAGEFVMGNEESNDELMKAFPGPGVKSDAFSNAASRHQVRITRPFFLGKYEVTIAQFRRFVEATAYQTEAEQDDEGGWGYDEKEQLVESRKEFNWRNTGFAQADDCPVVNVSWNDAKAFCEWLTRTDGARYRLPTEAEWEYACRAGRQTRYANGNDPERLVEIGNAWDAGVIDRFPNAVNQLSQSDGYIFSAPIGNFQPNAFGLHDMHGNVWEWCADRFDADYYQTSVVDDPQGPATGSSRVYRGGGWINNAGFCRSAIRRSVSPSARYSDLGFRVAISFEE